MTGPKNIDRSLKKTARRNARDAANALRNIRNNKTAMAHEYVYAQVLTCQRSVDFLIAQLKEQCRDCGKKVPFGCTLCAGCADERGP